MIHSGYRGKHGARDKRDENREELRKIYGRLLIIRTGYAVPDDGRTIVKRLPKAGGMAHFRVLKNPAGLSIEQIALACDRANLLEYGYNSAGEYVNIYQGVCAR